MNLRPYVGQKITFKREHSNPNDSFAVPGKTMFKGKIAPVTADHVPRELARYVWYAIMEGGKFKAVVHEEKGKPHGSHKKSYPYCLPEWLKLIILSTVTTWMIQRRF